MLLKNNSRACLMWLMFLQSRLDKILDYELPYASGFREMRNTLRDINDKMTKHRMLIDRYSGLQMNEDNDSVADRVAAKVEELIPRCVNPIEIFNNKHIRGYHQEDAVSPSDMKFCSFRVPALSGVQNPFRPRNDEINSAFDPRLIPVSLYCLF